MNSVLKKGILLLISLSIAIASLYAQSKSSSSSNSEQHFLWFTGHWSSSKKNTFITDAYTDSTDAGVMKMPGGTSITVNSNGSVNINSSDVDNWDSKIDNGEKDLEKTIKELTDPSNEMQEWAYHFNQATIPLLDSLQSEWASYKIGKKEDILNPEQQNKTPAPSIESIAAQFCRQAQPKYQVIIDFYNAHKNDKSYNIPPPPQFDLTCSACDTDLVKKQAKEDSIYENNFFKPENKLIEDGLAIERSLMLLGLNQGVYKGNTPAYDQYVNLFHKDKNDPSKSGPCAYLDNYELNKAIAFLIMRQYNKAEKLLLDNRDNFRSAKAVIETFLTAARNCGISGFSVDSHFDVIGSVVKKAFDYYYNKLVKDHDWSQIANIPSLISLARNYKLVTDQDINDNMISELVKILNGFHLNIEMDIKVGKDQGYIIAHLKGQTKIAPEFNFAGDTCYQWVVTEDQPNHLGEPVKKSSMRINVDLLDNEIVIPKGRPTYIGTKKYWCMMEQLKMDYCHPGKDTILLTGFIPDPNAMAGAWQYPYSASVPLGINSLDHYFQDVNKMQQLAESGAAQQQAEIAKDQAEKLVAQMKAMQQKMGNQRSPSQIGNYQQMMNTFAKTQQSFNNQNLSPILYIDFPLQIQNNITTLFKKRFDAKEVNPRVAEAVIYGYYTVDIEYGK
jgi:hypothetical protein